MSDLSLEVDSTERTSAGRTDSKYQRALNWLDDRVNPVLVKEMRQALRGKQFRSSFIFTLVVSLIVAVSIVLSNSGQAVWNPIGPAFFQGIFYCLTVAVVGFVPMAAFSTMGAEWEENTYDMLILSHLRPRHIVVGKLLAAGVQALLYFSIFSPYIVFTFLLGGVDVILAVVTIPLLAVISLALSALAVGLSSLTDKRMGRVALMILLAAVLVGACMSVIAMTTGAIQTGIDFTSDEVKMAVTGILLGCVIVGGFAVTIATARLAHSEENRSTGLRILTFGLVLLSLAWLSWAEQFGAPAFFVTLMACVVIAGLMPMAMFFITEREGLGLRVKNHLPASPLLRVLAFPWLPGGARGFAWLVMTLAIILGWAYVATGSSVWSVGAITSGASAIGMGGISSGLGRFMDAPNALFASAAYCVIYLGLPSALLTNRTNTLARSSQARVLIPVLFFGALLLPMIAGFLLGIKDLARGNHIGNPFVTIAQIMDQGKSSGTIVAIAGGVCLLHFMRLKRAIVEVGTAPRAGSMASPETGVTMERVSEPDTGPAKMDGGNDA